MIRDLAYYFIFGKSIIFYSGIITFLAFLFTALISVLNMKGIHLIHFKWHKRMAFISIVIALVHAILGLSISFNF